MVKLAALPAREVIDGLKGTIDFYVQHGQVCARRWPRNRHAGFTPGSRSTWPHFKAALAAALASWPRFRELARIQTNRTSWTWRDYLMKCWYGTTGLRDLDLQDPLYHVSHYSRPLYHPTFTLYSVAA